MGARGDLAVTKRDVIFEPAFKVKEVDPTGAGDAYDAAFLYGILKKVFRKNFRVCRRIRSN